VRRAVQILLSVAVLALAVLAVFVGRPGREAENRVDLSDLPASAVQAPKPRVVEEDVIETADVELVSLEDAEAPDVADDETAGIEDVDLGEEAADAEAEDDTFLVEEEEEGDSMSGILDTGGKEEDEES